MAEVLLINPAKRRKARRANPSPAQKRARAAFAAAARARRKNPAKRRRNPVAQAAVPYAENPRRRRRRVARRSNPALRTYRRRRNPIGGVSVNSIVTMLKDGAVMGAGAVAADLGYGYIANMLPMTLRAGPGQITAGSALKAVITAAAGKMLSRATNGLSVKAAQGALVVQARDIALALLPPSIAGSPAGVAGLGYATPAGRLVNYTARVGPNRPMGAGAGMGAYVAGRSPLLNGTRGGMGAYMTPGATPLLSGSARVREGYPR